jgi:single-stranded DNA-binding protein
MQETPQSKKEKKKEITTSQIQAKSSFLESKGRSWGDKFQYRGAAKRGQSSRAATVVATQNKIGTLLLNLIRYAPFRR